MPPRQTLGLTFLALLAGAYAQQGGQAVIAVQGYYQGSGAQKLLNTTGIALKFQEVLPKIGLIVGSLEGYSSGGSVRPANNSLELRGFRRGALRWNLTGGDFQATPVPVQNPFSNLLFPQLNARGFQVEASDSKRSYTFFYGKETVLAGVRIPFRVNVPQTALGLGVSQKFGRLQTGVRWLHLTTSRQELEANPILFPAGRQFMSADNLTGLASYAISKHLTWYGEATVGRTRSLSGSTGAQALSYFSGLSWESPRVVAKANFANLGRSYFPAAGYWVGDRKGPFAELRVKPTRRVELFASASRYETTVKDDPGIPYLNNTGTSVGGSVELPGQMNASLQVSSIRFFSVYPQSDVKQDSRNHQVTASFSKQIGRQSLRLTAREMRLEVSGVPSRQRSAEFSDSLRVHGLVVGATVRAQQSLATERRNSVYVRGSVQGTVGRLTAYASVEGGKDLVNQTVFSTTTNTSSMLHANLRLNDGWSVQGEAYRSRLLASLNAESVFIHGNQGVYVNPVLNRFNQWSVLFRVARDLHWGRELPSGGLDQYVRQNLPLLGSVEGFTKVRAAGELRPAPDVVLTLENGQRAVSDSQGRYRFESVAEGAHTVSIKLEELPADYDLGSQSEAHLTIRPGRIARVDLDLVALGAFLGRVTLDPAGVDPEPEVKSGANMDTLEGILLRLSPGDAYTTTLPDGSFAFYNRPDGDYTVTLEESTLPSQVQLKSAAIAAVTIRTGTRPSVVRFAIEPRPEEVKPVRRVLEQQIEIEPLPAARPPVPPVPPASTLPPVE